MKKLMVFIGALLFSVVSYAADSAAGAPIEDGKQYFVLQKFPSPQKEVVEIFSFNCSACYIFDTQVKGAELIKESLPEGVVFKKYNLESFGANGAALSEGWAVANILNIQDKFSDAMYNAIHKERSIKSADDIINVFVKLGVSEEEYNKTKNSLPAKMFMAQQATAISELKPASIPTLFVNGKYAINQRGLDASSNEAIMKDYVRVINYLVEQK